MRSLLTRLHRYTGLVTACFLFVAGVTGSVIVFWPELDVVLNPDLYRATGTGAPLPPSALAAKVEAADPSVQVVWIPLRLSAGEAAAVAVRPRADSASAAAASFDQVFVDPATGDIIGRRTWGACCFERRHIIPFLHTLHYTLYLPGRWGVWLMGLIALAWLIDCFVAIALTLPRRAPFLSRWGSSFRISRGAGGGRLLLDLHRAGGLWLWLALVPIAMGGFALNLYAEMFRPAVAFLLPVTPEHEPPKAKPGARLIGFDAALALGAAEAQRRGWEPPGVIYYDREAGTYSATFHRSQLDRGEGLGISALTFDGVSGALIDAHIHGIGKAGDYVLEAQFPLHSGRLLGLPGRVIVCAAGLVVAGLSLTGLMMWSRRRKAQARLRAA